MSLWQVLTRSAQISRLIEIITADTNLSLVENTETHIIKVKLGTEASVRTIKLRRNFPMLFRAALRTVVLQNHSKHALWLV